MKEKVIVCWSGGKDSAMAVHEIQKSGNYEIVTLLTTLTQEYDRISMHGIRRVLLERQADELGLRLEKVLISKETSEGQYEAKMREMLEKYGRLGVSAVVFGDIFLEDLRKYREDNLAKAGMKGLFPLWKRDTTELAVEFIKSGFKAVTTCVDSQVLGRQFAGRDFDEKFLADLPANVDPCGENGEFHSFVYDGPIFKHGIKHAKGDVVLREERFYYCDFVESGECSIKSTS